MFFQSEKCKIRIL